MLDPKRCMPRSDMDEPMRAKSITEKVVPTLTIPSLSDIDEPRKSNDPSNEKREETFNPYVELKLKPCLIQFLMLADEPHVQASKTLQLSPDLSMKLM
jgi:hypothetical protein